MTRDLLAQIVAAKTELADLPVIGNVGRRIPGCQDARLETRRR